MALIDLLAPGLLGPLPVAGGEAIPRAPLLEWMLARAEVLPFGAEGTEASMLALAGMGADRSADCPVGALGLLGEGVDPGGACWLRADPVHLRADLNRLLVFDLGSCPPTPEQARALVALFNAHFADRGLRLLAPHPERWYLALADCPGIHTSSLEAVLGRSPDESLPTGDAAGPWRALLNEVQMLFHSAAVNDERESHGLVPVNGIWVHGAGRLPSGARPVADAFFGDDPVLRGLALLKGTAPRPVPVQGAELFGAGEHALVLWTGLRGPVLAGDVRGWTEALRPFEALLESLVGGLKRARGVQLRVCPADGRLFRVDGSGLRRFWRRRRPMAWWLEHC